MPPNPPQVMHKAYDDWAVSSPQHARRPERAGQERIYD